MYKNVNKTTSVKYFWRDSSFVGFGNGNKTQNCVRAMIQEMDVSDNKNDLYISVREAVL